MKQATAMSTTIFPTGSAARTRASRGGLRALFFPVATEGCLQPAVSSAQCLHAIVDGLIQNWVLDNIAYDLNAAGQVVMNVYLVGLGFKPENK